MRSKYLYGGVVLLTAGAAYAASIDSINAGWTPMVSLFGAGERTDTCCRSRA
jgi:hypothetical protein